MISKRSLRNCQKEGSRYFSRQQCRVTCGASRKILISPQKGRSKSCPLRPQKLIISFSYTTRIRGTKKDLFASHSWRSEKMDQVLCVWAKPEQRCGVRDWSIIEVMRRLKSALFMGQKQNHDKKPCSNLRMGKCVYWLRQILRHEELILILRYVIN